MGDRRPRPSRSADAGFNGCEAGLARPALDHELTPEAGSRDWQALSVTPPVLADEFLPAFDVSDAVAVVVDADCATTWRALTGVDLLDLGRRSPLVGVLGAARVLPEVVGHLLRGERPPKAPDSLRLRDMPSLPPSEGGWILLGERPDEEIALGLVGKFWHPVIEYAEVSADGFREFDEPGFAKTLYDLSVRPLDDGRTLLCGLMRTATTDEHARRWFRRYWTFGVGSGAHILVGSLLEEAREGAERGAVQT